MKKDNLMSLEKVFKELCIHTHLEDGDYELNKEIVFKICQDANIRIPIEELLNDSYYMCTLIKKIPYSLFIFFIKHINNDEYINLIEIDGIYFLENIEINTTNEYMDYDTHNYLYCDLFPNFIELLFFTGILQIDIFNKNEGINTEDDFVKSLFCELK